MPLVYPTEKSPSYKTGGSVNLSTNADGVTSADVIDMGGLSMTAIQLSTLVSTACTYALNGSLDSTAPGAVYTSTGGRVTFGSTLVDPRGTVISFDPAPYMGLRFVQLVSFTTAAAAPNATGATAKIVGAALGTIK